VVPSLRAVIFDFDGLLMDTESTSVTSWEREWRRWGLVLDRETFFVAHGGDVTERRYALLASAVGDTFDRDLSQRRRTADRDALNAALPLAPGMEGWLTEAADAGFCTAVASSSDVAWVRRHLSRAGVLHCFDVIAGGDEVRQHKPAPDTYQLALTRLGLTGSQAVAVEDTAHGVDAANAAGLACIAIRTHS
jgi:HAD superfamily hydrolase (TIGR01509 family)